MGQYDDKVQRQRLLLEAEKWASGVKEIHAHQLSSLWYDTRPQDTEAGPVVDRIFNDGLIERTLPSGEVIFLGEKATGDELIGKYTRHNADTRGSIHD